MKVNRGGREGLFAQQNAFLKLVDFFVMKFQIEVLCVWFLYKKKTKKDNYIMYLLTFFFLDHTESPKWSRAWKPSCVITSVTFSFPLFRKFPFAVLHEVLQCKNTSPESALATQWVYRQKWVSYLLWRLGDTLPRSQSKRTELFGNVFK